MRLLDCIQVGSDGRGFLESPYPVMNFIGGKLSPTLDLQRIVIPDPLTGKPSFEIPDSGTEDCMRAINCGSELPMGTNDVWPLQDRAKVFQTAGQLLGQYWQKFAAIIRLCVPKSKPEADGEIEILQRFLMSMSFDRLRRLSAPEGGGRGIGIFGPSETRVTPWGLVSILSPFNYPLEIEGVQVVAALACGNVVISHPHEYCGLASTALLELLLEAGMPCNILQLVYGYGPNLRELAMNKALGKILFTGSTQTLTNIYNDRIVAEDAGVNWMMIPGDYDTPVEKLAASVAHSFASFGGQRCSSLRIAGVHQSWINKGLLEAIQDYILKNYHFADGSLPALMSWSNKRIAEEFASMERAGIVRQWGGDPVKEFAYQKPDECLERRFDYGAATPALLMVQAKQLNNPAVAAHARKERFFGNLLVVPLKGDSDYQRLTAFLGTLDHHLTCAVATDTEAKAERVLRDVSPNGVTYWGLHPRTTGAPEYIPFGPRSVHGATIGGSDNHIRRMWCSFYAFTQLVEA